MNTTLPTNLNQQFVTSRGADPEFFIKNKETGDIVSAIEVLKRDKYDPIILGDDVSLYFDNAMGEFTVKPAFSRESFVESMRDAFTKIDKYIKSECGPEFEIVIQASHEFDEKYLNSEEAKKIGCNPEFSADDIMQIVPPDFSGTLRSAGGHIAVGRDDFKGKEDNDDHVLMGFQSKIDLIKLLDYYVGVPFTLIDNDETSLRRRKIYGSPSSHRPKDFGAEYRVLSCLWTSSPTLVGLIYDLSELAVQTLIENKQDEIFNKVQKDLVNACIKENNKELADEIVQLIDLPKNLQVRLNQLKNVRSWDFYKEWNLKKSAAKKSVAAV